MWNTSEEPPGQLERDPSAVAKESKETCEQNKEQLESFDEIMMRNQQSAKKKEEEVQEYLKRLVKIKSRAKLSRRSKEGTSSKLETSSSKADTIYETNPIDEVIDDISQARTPKAKSSLLQRKLAEDRKAFEQRSKEMTETKRAVEEKVEAIRQQLDEKNLGMMELQKDQSLMTPVQSVMLMSEVTSSIARVDHSHEADNKIVDLNNKIMHLEATIIDLQENLKEKDSVIYSKTKAITLMSADLSKKGKTTLDTLEDTKDEMRTMQEHFVLLETSLKNKNDNLLQQLQERDSRILQLEDANKSLEEHITQQKLAESTNAHVTRTTMDTLADTRDVMKSMQENFVLVESSLKSKNDNLLQQLEDYEVKLAEANEQIFQLESGAGIQRNPDIENLQTKLKKLEKDNRQLQDDKYELQKNIADVQNKIIISKSVNGSGAIMEKDNRIAELEHLVDELKRSNELLEEESKTELQKQLAELSLKTEEYSNRIVELDKLVHQLETEKSDTVTRLLDETSTTKEDEKVSKLTKELDELNKSMIKLKAQHRSKIKNLQKQLDNFKMVSDTNAELVRLENHVALLEEEKASAGDWQERIVDLENKVATQSKEIQMHIDAIATLENQKLDLTQELHTVRQEVSSLEAENAESENLRVTAEMKVVDLEEQLELINKTDIKSGKTADTSQNEYLERIEALLQENKDLHYKLLKLEEKSGSEVGSTELFETLHESEKNDLLRKVEDLTEKNNELTLKLAKIDEKDGSHAGSTESFEAINDMDKNELLRKIDQLTQENSDLLLRLSRNEEKGSSDTGSTESFERIPGHNENISKIELLTQENNDLVVKLYKLQEKLGLMESNLQEDPKSDVNTVLTSGSGINSDVHHMSLQVASLSEENNNLLGEVANLREKMTNIMVENTNFQNRIEALIMENNDLVIKHTKLEERYHGINSSVAGTLEKTIQDVDVHDQVNLLVEQKRALEEELEQLRNTLLQESYNTKLYRSELDNVKLTTDALLKENTDAVEKIVELETINKNLLENLNTMSKVKEELQAQIDKIQLETGVPVNRQDDNKHLIQEEQQLHDNISESQQEFIKELSTVRKTDDVDSQQTASLTTTILEKEIEEGKDLIEKQLLLIEEFKTKLDLAEQNLQLKEKEIVQHTHSLSEIQTGYEECKNELQVTLGNLREMEAAFHAAQYHMSLLDTQKVSIEKELQILQDANKHLQEELEQKDTATSLLKENFENTIAALSAKLQQESEVTAAKEQEIIGLKAKIQSSDHEVHTKCIQLQNQIFVLNKLQDEVSSCKDSLQEKAEVIASLLVEREDLKNIIGAQENKLDSFEKDTAVLHGRVEESKTLKEYTELLNQLHDKERQLNELKKEIDEQAIQNSNLLVEVERVSQHSESKLVEKQREITDLIIIKENLDAQLSEKEDTKNSAEKRAWKLQETLDNQTKFINDLQSELQDSYKLLEELKVKHTEDLAMLNRRLEEVTEELSVKMQENKVLKMQMEEKDMLIGHDIPEQEKLALVEEVADLKQQLSNSESKAEAQIEKMKKIMANLKKKTGRCQELEARVVELEEKWTTEKDEKSVKNKKIQEVESLMREKDNQITDLTEKLIQAKNETSEALSQIESLTNEITNSKEKMTQLMHELTDTGKQLQNINADFVQLSDRYKKEKELKDAMHMEYEMNKEQMIRENEQCQMVLDEVKENARELSVRMQVMEGEYLEQLALIKNLQAENCLLSSKQTQINEKLENTEKESEERRLLIEELQKEVVTKSVAATTQTMGEDYEQDDGRMSGVQHGAHCEQCQTLVHALEAKLQEREAEIENLDNELANSIGNFVQMRESLRFNDMMNQSSIRNRSFEDLYNDLLFQYNTLISNNEEAQTKLDATLKGNTELNEKIESLQTLNATLSERIRVLEQDAAEDKQAREKLENVEALYAELLEKHSHLENNLLSAQQELQSSQDRVQQLEQELKVQVAQFESDSQNELTKFELLKSEKEDLERQVEHLTGHKDLAQTTVTSLQVDSATEINQEGKVTTEVEKSQESSNIPQLFDAAKIFGIPSDSSSDQLEIKASEELQNLMQQYNKILDELNASQQRISTLENVILEKNEKIEALNGDIEGFKFLVSAAQIPSDIVNRGILLKDQRIEELNLLHKQQTETLESYKDRIANLEDAVQNSPDADYVEDLERRMSVILKDKELLQIQVQDFSRALEEEKKSVVDSRDMQNRIEIALRERDEARTLVANLTQTLEEQQQKVSQVASKDQEPLNEPKLCVDPLSLQSSDEKDDWDIAGNEKFTGEEETWAWTADGGQLTIQEEHVPVGKLISDAEAELRVKIDELQDRLTELENEKIGMAEEIKAAQIKNGKFVKKLKEYKVQTENLQRQLKIQRSADVCGLDSAIVDEFKSQIATLEKTLKETKEDHKAVHSEKDALLKRLDVLVAANERYMEMKERQDMEVEVLRIQNRELNNKIQSSDEPLQKQQVLDSDDAKSDRRGVQEENYSFGSFGNSDASHGVPRKREVEELREDADLRAKYQGEIDDLTDQINALAVENEQLQKFLEEQKIHLSTLESKHDSEIKHYGTRLEEATRRSDELQNMLDKSKEEYNDLKRTYQQYVSDADDQLAVLRRNNELLEVEMADRSNNFQVEIKELRQKVEDSTLKIIHLEKELENSVETKKQLDEKISDLVMSEEKLSSVTQSLTQVTDLSNNRMQELVNLKQELEQQYLDRQKAETKLEETIENLTRELNQKLHELDSLREDFSSMERELIQQKSAETVNAAVSQATQELEQRHAIVLEERNNQIRELTYQLSVLQSNVEQHSLQFQDAILNKEQEIAHLKESLLQSENLLETTNSDLRVARDKLLEKQSESGRCNDDLQKYMLEAQNYISEIDNLQSRLKDSAHLSATLNDQVRTLEQELETLKVNLHDTRMLLQQRDAELKELETRLESDNQELLHLRAQQQQLEVIQNELRDRTDTINGLNSELEEARKSLSEKESSLDILTRRLNESQLELEKLSSFTSNEQLQPTSTLVDGLPLFRMNDSDTDDTTSLQATVDELKVQLETKQEEIDHLNYMLSENTYPSMIQELQDSVNCLSVEKEQLQTSLDAANQRLAEQERQIENLTKLSDDRSQGGIVKEESVPLSRERRSIEDQGEIVRMQNELHAKEQEINDLKYVIAEKESQLALQATIEPQSDEFELRDSVQRLTAELYGKQQEIEYLRSTADQLESKVLRLKDTEDAYAESRELVERLNAEKEKIRVDSEVLLEKKLREKELEIDQWKERLHNEYKKIFDELQLKNDYVENLKRELEQSNVNWHVKLREKDEELQHTTNNLTEKERRLAELSITKDAELHNLKVQIQEKEVRIEELLALSEEEERQLTELRRTLETKEMEINYIKEQLENRVKEYELIQNALKKDVPVVDVQSGQVARTTLAEEQETSNEFDLALYMLHQRDVRCEELTHELMQLLEERDTLQLRLSNAIRVNEELRRVTDQSPKKDVATSSISDEPIVEHPSPSRSEGPVEIAKDVLDTSIGEDKEILAQKLSQLHTVGHAKDVRLRDERELRHTQQMSLLAHKDVLSTLPPEAAARIVNANYTLSRDVQSQSSVLLNWLWGKSTPKVVHM